MKRWNLHQARWAFLSLAATTVLAGCEPSSLEGPKNRVLSDGPQGAIIPTHAFVMGGVEEVERGVLQAPEIDVRTLQAAPSAVGQAGGFPVVIVRSGNGAGKGNGPVVDNLADAVAMVAPGGTIRIFPGEYQVDGVTIQKAVTIVGTGGRPVIRNTTSAFSFGVVGPFAGLVTFRGLDFELTAGSDGSIQALFDSHDVLVENCSFDASGSVSGIRAFAVTPGQGKVTVRNSSFRNGSVGTFAYNGATIDVENSSFAGHTFGGLQYQGSTSGTVTGNDIGPCGIYSCIRVFASDVDVTNNRLTESRTDVNGFFHNLVIYGSDATGTVSNNEFDGCGHGQCVAAISRADIAVVNNTFTIYPDHDTRFAVAAADGYGGTEPDYSQYASNIFALGNTIQAAPGSVVADRNDPNSYALIHAGMLAENAGTITAIDNDISNAHTGIMVAGWNQSVSGSDGGVVNGSGNSIDLVHDGILIWGSSQVDFRSNDFTDYVFPISEGNRDEPSDLTCNWWGSVSGPAMVAPSVDPALYTPWATSPVAGTGSMSCIGGI
ncbi:MAG: right-handed parallel beta-helix repeat-containing protein [Gemmatimonadota bacterium]|nr:right-handed parallel beta-helix repeat-containing protein [Gemmatimonadota bacterium]